MSLKDDLKSFSITEEDRKRLSPQEIAELEELVRQLRANPPPGVKLHNPEKFDAKDMQPLGKGPVNWEEAASAIEADSHLDHEMPNVRDALKTFVITDEVRKQLTPEQLEDLEELIKSAQTGADTVTLHNPDKFDAKDMQPVGKGPVNWNKPRR